MKWKYKVIALSSDAQTKANELTKHGSEGWELVTVQREEHASFAFLKQAAVEPKRKVHL